MIPAVHTCIIHDNVHPDLPLPFLSDVCRSSEGLRVIMQPSGCLTTGFTDTGIDYVNLLPMVLREWLARVCVRGVRACVCARARARARACVCVCVCVCVCR